MKLPSMLKEKKLGTTTRMSFSHIDDVVDLPDLVEIQKDSYKWFRETGLREALQDVSPVESSTGNLSVEFIDYSMTDEPKYSIEECKERDATYEVPLSVLVRIRNKDTGVATDSSVYMGNIPLMTDKGTFVINGAERVVVSQLVRSPGMYYDYQVDKMGKWTYSGQVIPYRGAWLEFETDANDVFYVKIDKNRKVPVTVLIRALGEAVEEDKDEDIFNIFGHEPMLVQTLTKDECQKNLDADGKNGSTLGCEALKEIYRKMRPGEPVLIESARILMGNTFFDPRRYDLEPVGRYKFDLKMALGYRIQGLKLAEDAISEFTGEIVCEKDTIITKEIAQKIDASAVNCVYVYDEEGTVVKVFGNGTSYPKDLIGEDLKDCGIREKVVVKELVKLMEQAGGDMEVLKGLVVDNRSKLAPHHITKDDIMASINYLLCLTHNIGRFDDIDHLGNRRLRCVGELLQNQIRIGMTRMEKNIRDRMAIHDSEEITARDLINARPVGTAIREFFGSSPLSQFMDQNNPLAELTHKRRLSALGPGGLTRDRASFDVRDVHYTQYGRMCPIETPEGPNIGLISYLATYAKLSEYGFLKAPFRRVIKGKGIVTNEVVYMTADEEDQYVVAQANEKLNPDGSFVNKRVIARDKNEIVELEPEQIDFMDASPRMLVSVATACIPFLENDDNTRALMGSNMQKQAVPLLMTEAPIVATGTEYKAAIDSGAVIVSKADGVVRRACDEWIYVLNDDGVMDKYHLSKFKRSNQGTSINQRPIVNVGDRVTKGQVIADGPATSNGEISLGKNALIGFMTWEGYNYEDAVLLNEKLVRYDMYTSVHIEEYSMEARDTKLGPQEITREVPNAGNQALANLDQDGIVRIGTEVRANDILVGKVTPKGETDLTPEERLLRAIFGEKAKEVRDSSLRLPHGASGIVVDVKIYNRSNSNDLAPGVNSKVCVYVAQKRKISVGDKMAGRHGNKGVVSRILPPEDMPFLADGTPLDIVLNPLGVPSRMNIGQVLEVHLGIAAKRLGIKIMTPVFDGANERDIIECLRCANYTRNIRPEENVAGKALFIESKNDNGEINLERVSSDIENDPIQIRELIAKYGDAVKVIDGKVNLYDGRTGELFSNPVTVGIMYYLKLHHLVDDKIHARSNGPYSLVTQQPLGGKAQFGGQRFGEMEVWALEAYGAAYTLQEILTVKSDDINGRTKAYEAIIKGENIPTPGVPESFRVLVKELQSLMLNVQVFDKEGNEIDLSEIVDTPTLKTPEQAPAYSQDPNHMTSYTSDEDVDDMEEDIADENEFDDGLDEEVYDENELDGFQEVDEDVDFDR